MYNQEREQFPMNNLFLPELDEVVDWKLSKAVDGASGDAVEAGQGGNCIFGRKGPVMIMRPAIDG